MECRKRCRIFTLTLFLRIVAIMNNRLDTWMKCFWEWLFLCNLRNGSTFCLKKGFLWSRKFEQKIDNVFKRVENFVGIAGRRVSHTIHAFLIGKFTLSINTSIFLTTPLNCDMKKFRCLLWEIVIYTQRQSDFIRNWLQLIFCWSTHTNKGGYACLHYFTTNTHTNALLHWHVQSVLYVWVD